MLGYGRYVGVLLAALIAAMTAAAPAAAQMECAPRQWQKLNYPSVGLSVEADSDNAPDYGIVDGRSYMAIDENVRLGKTVEGRCSSFKFDTRALSASEAEDPTSLFQTQAKDDIANRDDVKIVRNRVFNFQGQPAAEVVYSFTRDMIGGSVTKRSVMVVRDNRLYGFYWYWDDKGPVPADAARIYDSIRFTPVVADPHARSIALLWSTIQGYWLSTLNPQMVFLSPALKRIADSKRVAESKLVASYGWPRKITFVRSENGYKVFRVEHSMAVVDWYTVDDGRLISALTWQKIRDIEVKRRE